MCFPSAGCGAEAINECAIRPHVLSPLGIVQSRPATHSGRPMETHVRATCCCTTAVGMITCPTSSPPQRQTGMGAVVNYRRHDEVGVCDATVARSRTIRSSQSHVQVCFVCSIRLLIADTCERTINRKGLSRMAHCQSNWCSTRTCQLTTAISWTPCQKHWRSSVSAFLRMLLSLGCLHLL